MFTYEFIFLFVIQEVTSREETHVIGIIDPWEFLQAGHNQYL